MSLRHRSTKMLILAAACLLAVPGFARADQVVYFTNGKAITVKTVEKGPKLTILEIEGGGRIGIPTVQIDRIEDLNLSPPAPVAAPQTPVTAIIPQQPTAAPAQTVPQPQSTIPAGPGTGGHVAQNSALKMAPPLAVGGDLGDGDGHKGAPQAQATQSTPPGGVMGRQANRNPGMMGGPGAMQRGRRGYNPYNHGLPSGAQMNQGAGPQGAPNATPPGQPAAPGQPNAAAQAGSGQPAAGSQAAQSGQPSQAQAPPASSPPPQTPPAAAAAPPPPPPPDPEPNDAESGNSDTSDDGSSSSDNDSSSGGDSGN